MSRLDASQITSKGSDDNQPSSGGSDFLSNLEGIIEQVESSPQLQQFVQMAMQSQGMDMQESGQVMDNNAQVESETDGSDDNEANLLGLVQALEEQVGGDFTISQIRMYMEQNPDHVEQLSDEYL